MRRQAGKWILLCAFAATCLTAAPASAQFEEPDTIRPWAIGPFIEATFRGARGTAAGEDLDFANGPAFGARLERRLGRTLTFGVLGSYARSAEQTGAGAAGTGEQGDMTLLNFAGELVFRVKPEVPGYFLFGGGVHFVSPDADENRFGRSDDYIEPLAVVGLGLEPFSRRNGALRLYGRLYITATADQPGFNETNSLSTDFALGLIYVLRF